MKHKTNAGRVLRVILGASDACSAEARTGRIEKRPLGGQEPRQTALPTPEVMSDGHYCSDKKKPGLRWRDRATGYSRVPFGPFILRSCQVPMRPPSLLVITIVAERGRLPAP